MYYVVCRVSTWLTTRGDRVRWSVIGYLRGRVLYKSLKELLVDVRDVGYRVKIGEKMYRGVTEGEEVELFIHTQVREDALELYGFAEMKQLKLFEMIIGVSGVGPKIGMAIVGMTKAEAVERAVREANVEFFQRIPGIGRKGAQRIIVDLKGKIAGMAELDLAAEGGEDEVMEALMSFGFGRAEVEAVRRKFEADLSMEEQIKMGLKMLGRR